MCDLDGCGTHNNMPPIALSETDRRAFLIGAASLPLATILFYPELAAAQGAKPIPITIDTKGGGKASGVIAMPAETPAPAVVLVHEWWGLNDQIKAVAQEYAENGYIAVAVDLYGKEAATTPEGAKAMMSALDGAAATDAMVSWVDYLRTHEKGNGKVGTVGWCFGGGWSLNASIATPVDATVIFYGNVKKTAEQLSKLKGPVLGHFGTEDKNINAAMVGGFEEEMKKAGKADTLTVHWYEANHAFANPTGARYDAEDAALAWERTMAFFGENLKG
ncbi:MAG: dienelactone hydrolase family protein [Hyphomicrobiales bacterium]|nr:dienelactone hydrolase family protein [Hyphomicrobiales bacterium]